MFLFFDGFDWFFGQFCQIGNILWIRFGYGSIICHDFLDESVDIFIVHLNSFFKINLIYLFF